ncbi:hypothetical protein ACHAXT_009346 [Thalassiosira profunda]
MAAPRFHLLVVGHGEIARRAHLPALQARSDVLVVGLVDVRFSVEATSADATDGELKFFATLADAFRYFREKCVDIHAVSICTPKAATLSVACEVLQLASSNKDSTLLGILLEKPPGEDVEQLKRTVQLGISQRVSIFTACHTSVCPAREVIDKWLFADETIIEDCKSAAPIANAAICKRRLECIRIVWKENVRKWHPGQAWIATARGGGVTDMLFNPISLLVSLFDLSYRSDTQTSGGDDTNVATGSVEESSTIRLVKADLIRPSNWEAPISGKAELLLTVPLIDEAKRIVRMEVPISAEFAFDHEPPPGEKEEVWSMEFVESDTKSGERTSVLTLTEGGAQAYLGSTRVTSKPTAAYPLGPEYEALYDRFLELLRENQAKNTGEAPCSVDCTTMEVLNGMLERGRCAIGPPFEF